MLKVFGTPGSRAARTLWMCRELGVDYEHVPVHYLDGGTNSPDYLAINPAGRIPAIDLDGFRLAESMAINLYLARKFGSELMPSMLEDEARVWQWSFWVMTEVEKPLLQVLLQRSQFEPGSAAEKYFRERSPKDPQAEQAAVQALQTPLAVLNEHLAQQPYLLGSRFTVADLNVASVFTWAVPAKLDLSAFPNARDWLERCLARPAAKAKKK